MQTDDRPDDVGHGWPSGNDKAELANLYHLTRTALVSPSRHSRLLWVARQFSKEHPEISEALAYKWADRETSQPNP